jgi:DNA polymerase III epsilon subunit-like protein
MIKTLSLFNCVYETIRVCTALRHSRDDPLFICFDLETSGLSSDKHQILQIGADIFHSTEEKEHTFLARAKWDSTRFEFDDGTTRIHGMKKTDTQGTSIDELVNKFMAWLAGVQLRTKASDIYLLSYSGFLVISFRF